MTRSIPASGPPSSVGAADAPTGRSDAIERQMRPPRILTAIGIGLLFATLRPPLHAQVIRSYETLDRSAEDGRYLTLATGFDARGGNTKEIEFNATGALGVRGDRHWIRLYPSYLAQRIQGDVTKHERSLHLRHSYFISGRTRTFTFVQLQADESLDLDRRFLVGGGVRRRLVAAGDDGGLDLGAGLMWEDERLEGDIHEETVRVTSLVSLHSTAGVVRITLTGFFQPQLSSWSDHRVSSVGSATVPLGERWALDVAGFWRRDSRPPSGVGGDDGGLSLGLRLSLG